MSNGYKKYFISGRTISNVATVDCLPLYPTKPKTLFKFQPFFRGFPKRVCVFTLYFCLFIMIPVSECVPHSALLNYYYRILYKMSSGLLQHIFRSEILGAGAE